MAVNTTSCPHRSTVDDNQSTDGNINFCRKLDRTLEHYTKFKDIPLKDEKLICGMRSTVLECKKKIETLKEELERSQVASEKNEFLRRAAEERLRKQLVSKYGFQDISTELRHSFPETNNTSTFVSMYNSAKVDAELRERLPHSNVSCPEFSIIHSDVPVFDETSVTAAELSQVPLMEIDDNFGTSSDVNLDFKSCGSPPIFTPMVLVSEKSADDRKIVQNSNIVSNLLNSSDVQDKWPTVNRPLSHSTPLKQKLRLAENESVPRVSINRLTSSDAIENEVLRSKMQLLMQTNKKLTERLATRAKDEQIDNILLEKINELYDTQKTCEEAILGHLHRAYAERDEAVKQLYQSQNTIFRDHLPKAHPADPAANDVTLTLEAVEAQGQLWVREIERYQENLQKIAHEEMQVVIEERDQALTECDKLKKELLRLERLSNIHASTSTTEHNLQTKLELIRKERDYALMKAQMAEEETQNIKLYYSLQHSLSTSTGSLTPADGQPNTDTESVDSTRKHNIPKTNEKFHSKMNKLQHENEKLSADVKKLKTQHEEMKATKKQLETLVTVLRRKLASSNQRV